jgi:acetyltransferase
LEVFHGTLSERTILSRYLRPFDLSARTAPERLRRVCYTDYDREMVFVACPFDAPDAPLWAVGRLSHRPGGEPSARFSLLVSDPHQKKGLGTAFLQHLMSVAAREGLSSVWADIRQDNTEMLKILSRLGFDLMTCADGTCRARRAVRVDHRLSMDSTVSPAPERAEKLR